MQSSQNAPNVESMPAASYRTPRDAQLFADYTRQMMFQSQMMAQMHTKPVAPEFFNFVLLENKILRYHADFTNLRQQFMEVIAFHVAQNNEKEKMCNMLNAQVHQQKATIDKLAAELAASKRKSKTFEQRLTGLERSLARNPEPTGQQPASVVLYNEACRHHETLNIEFMEAVQDHLFDPQNGVCPQTKTAVLPPFELYEKVDAPRANWSKLSRKDRHYWRVLGGKVEEEQKYQIGMGWIIVVKNEGEGALKRKLPDEGL